MGDVTKRTECASSPARFERSLQSAKITKLSMVVPEMVLK